MRFSLQQICRWLVSASKDTHCLVSPEPSGSFELRRASGSSGLAVASTLLRDKLLIASRLAGISQISASPSAAAHQVIKKHTVQIVYTKNKIHARVNK